VFSFDLFYEMDFNIGEGIGGGGSIGIAIG
jgi:hypothetical protein